MDIISRALLNHSVNEGIKKQMSNKSTAQSSIKEIKPAMPTNEQAVQYIIEQTAGRNYVKHMKPELHQLMVRDIVTTLLAWEGPKEEGKVFGPQQEEKEIKLPGDKEPKK